MKLLTQPGDSVGPLTRAIDRAKKTIEIVIFRFDRSELERALHNAVQRGVAVHALIAYTNRGGEKKLRDLEMRFLASGITVARSADDLVRYHGKMMLIDRKELFLLGFNFIYLDIERSRSFGVITRNRQLVQEAAKLFECDTKRRTYHPGSRNFLVSPLNARKQLATFIKGARKELLIYDIEITDRQMIHLLEERVDSGVNVRILGPSKRKIAGAVRRKMSDLRLHCRVIVRDRHQMFLGSQSLRELELDGRREMGIIFRDAKVIQSLVKTFKSDWEAAGDGEDVKKKKKQEREHSAKVAKKVAKRVTRTLAKKLPPVAPVLQAAVKEVMRENSGIELDHKEVEEAVKDAVKGAVKGAVQEMVEEAAAEQIPDKV